MLNSSLFAHPSLPQLLPISTMKEYQYPGIIYNMNPKILCAH